jgi:hypothetical protein
MKIDIEQKKIKTSKNLIDIQSADGNWNYSPYMHGMLNGMLLIHSVFTDESFEPYGAPLLWKRTRWYEKIINKLTGRNKYTSEKTSPVKDIK